MAKLTDTQLVILSAAAQRKDRAVLPLPKSLKTKGAAVTKTLDGLRKKGLLEEKPASREAAAWRQGKDGRRKMLVITKAGLGALDGEPARESGKQPTPTKARTKKPRAVRKPAAANLKNKQSASAVRPGTKQALLIDLLKRKRGATIAEARDVTGWQSHALRAAITRLRKHGFLIERSKNGGVSHYRIVAQRKAA